MYDKKAKIYNNIWTWHLQHKNITLMLTTTKKVSYVFMAARLFDSNSIQP